MTIGFPRGPGDDRRAPGCYAWRPQVTTGTVNVFCLGLLLRVRLALWLHRQPAYRRDRRGAQARGRLVPDHARRRDEGDRQRAEHAPAAQGPISAARRAALRAPAWGSLQDSARDAGELA